MRQSIRLTLILLFLIHVRDCFGLINAIPLRGLPDLVRLRFTNRWICSGVFVDEYTILTTAHCLIPALGEKLELNKIESANDEIVDVYIMRIGRVLFFIGSSETTETPRGERASIAPNDSGAPVLNKNSNKIIAVATTTTAKDSFRFHLPVLSTATVIDAEFISSQLGPSK